MSVFVSLIASLAVYILSLVVYSLDLPNGTG